tara:strand:- start:828 stop:983 length:156 start_codon:yes stop_codon:yes gene_type:complete
MIGVPKGSMALIIKVEVPTETSKVYTVKFIGRTSGRATRRMLGHDLEVVSG